MSRLLRLLLCAQTLAVAGAAAPAHRQEASRNPVRALLQASRRLRHSSSDLGREASQAELERILPVEGPLPTQPPAWVIAGARAALSATIPPPPTYAPGGPRPGDASFPTGLPPWGMGYWAAVAPPGGVGECVENPRACPCTETIRQCREEIFMCEESMKELQHTMPKVWQDNYMS